MGPDSSREQLAKALSVGYNALCWLYF
jgi:hypothetical protein